jgi:tetratricopeptide (TPR) repeat protein
MIVKADEAYKTGDEATAMVYYEMLFNSGHATRRVKNNLCYLYGKRGAWFGAKEIIEKEKYASKLIYAYAYGALESNQEGFIHNLAEYILMDKTGKLALLAGYYYEQKEDMQRALSYYKMAYEKNPSNKYNIYAYARALDIQNDDKKALRYYKKVLQKMKKSENNYNLIYNRILQLKGI